MLIKDSLQQTVRKAHTEYYRDQFSFKIDVYPATVAKAYKLLLSHNHTLSILKKSKQQLISDKRAQCWRKRGNRE